MAIEAGDVVWNVIGDTSKFERAMDSARGKAKGLGDSFLKHSKRIGIGLTAAGATITGVMGIAVKSATDFQSELATLNTLGVKNLDSLGESIKDVSARFGQDLVASTTAAYNAISAGVEEEAIPAFLEMAATAATAGKSTLDTAVKLGAGLSNAFGKSASEVEGIFDEAFIAVQKGVTTFEELAASVGDVAPSFAAAGLGSDQMFASITALTKGMVSTAKASTQMKALMASIIKPTSQLDELFKDLGGAFSAMQELGLQKFLVQIRERVDGNVSAMSDLFGSQEAFNAALALSGEQAESFAEALELMENGAGATVEAFDKMVEADPSFAFRQLKSQMQVLLVDIGSALLPALKRIVDFVQPIVSSIVEWMKNHKQLSSVIIGAVAALGALMVVLGPIFIMLPGIATAFGVVSSALGVASVGFAGVGGAAGVAGVSLVGLLGPIAAVAIGVIALVGSIGFAANAIIKYRNRMQELEETHKRGDKAFNDLIARAKEAGIAFNEAEVRAMGQAKGTDFLLQKQFELEDQQGVLTSAIKGTADAQEAANQIVFRSEDSIRRATDAMREQGLVLARAEDGTIAAFDAIGVKAREATTAEAAFFAEEEFLFNRSQRNRAHHAAWLEQQAERERALHQERAGALGDFTLRQLQEFARLEGAERESFLRREGLLTEFMGSVNAKTASSAQVQAGIHESLSADLDALTMESREFLKRYSLDTPGSPSINQLAGSSFQNYLSMLGGFQTQIGAMLGTIRDMWINLFSSIESFVSNSLAAIGQRVSNALGSIGMPGFQSGGVIGDGIQSFQSGGVVRAVATAGIAAASVMPAVASPNIQAMQTGGVVRVGEAGPELAVLPVGTRVLPAGDARTVARDAMGGGGTRIELGGIHIGTVQRTGNSREDARRTVEAIMPELISRLTDAYDSADRGS